MPRLPHSLLLRAYKISPLLPLVLRGTRTLDSAINELRWLREHVEASNPPSPQASRKRLLHLCKRRSRAEPLQYILGSQPFGPLDIKCRPGVLIPRPETEAYTSHLADLLISGQLDEYLSINATETRPGRILPRRKQLSILDVCSGSGCISLLLHSLLSKSGKFPNLRTLGLDISPQAVALANENLARNIRDGHFPTFKTRNEIDASEQERGLENACFHPKPKCEKPSAVKFPWFSPDKAIQFTQHDIFAYLQPPIDHFSIIICNPPYISSSAFARETTRSVRLYEPKLALVPDPEKYPSSKKTKKKTPSTAPESEPKLPIQPFTLVEPPSSSSKNHKPLLAEPNPADIFYHQLLHIYTLTSARLLLLEVADAPQALRILQSFLSSPSIAKTNKVEIWRDYPGQEAQEGEETSFGVDGVVVPVKGAGSVRSVVLFRVPNAVKEGGWGGEDGILRVSE